MPAKKKQNVPKASGEVLSVTLTESEAQLVQANGKVTSLTFPKPSKRARERKLHKNPGSKDVAKKARSERAKKGAIKKRKLQYDAARASSAARSTPAAAEDSSCSLPSTLISAVAPPAVPSAHLAAGSATLAAVPSAATCTSSGSSELLIPDRKTPSSVFSFSQWGAKTPSSVLSTPCAKIRRIQKGRAATS